MKRTKSGLSSWSYRKCPVNLILVVTSENIETESEEKTYMKVETGDALALLIVMLYLSSLS